MEIHKIPYDETYKHISGVFSSLHFSSAYTEHDKLYFINSSYDWKIEDISAFDSILQWSDDDTVENMISYDDVSRSELVDLFKEPSHVSSIFSVIASYLGKTDNSIFFVIFDFYTIDELYTLYTDNVNSGSLDLSELELTFTNKLDILKSKLTSHLVEIDYNYLNEMHEIISFTKAIGIVEKIKETKKSDNIYFSLFPCRTEDFYFPYEIKQDLTDNPDKSIDIYIIQTEQPSYCNGYDKFLLNMDTETDLFNTAKKRVFTHFIDIAMGPDTISFSIIIQQLKKMGYDYVYFHSGYGQRGTLTKNIQRECKELNLSNVIIIGTNGLHDYTLMNCNDPHEMYIKTKEMYLELKKTDSD